MKRNHATTIWCAVALGAALFSIPAWGQVLPGFCSSGGKIGPCEGFVDLNANGVYDPGEPLVGFQCAEPGDFPTLQILNPWSDNCGDTSGNVIYLDSDNGTCFNSGHRLKGREFQSIQATDFSNNHPDAFSFSDSGASGNGALVGPGGGFNGLSITGGMQMLVGPFQGTDASGKGGAFNHITIPWGLGAALGMNGPCKIAPTDPQIFLPVVDLGNGQYQLQFDLCGDSRFCSSPPLSLIAWVGVGTNIPTLSEWGMIILVLGTAALGWWFLRQQQVLA
jgi:hypothetical protein